MMSWGMFLAIPCPCRIWDEKARPHMVACLPLTGGVVGLVWAAMAWLLQRLGCPAPLRAVLLAAAPWLVTGFLHLDGYMDVCDALLSEISVHTAEAGATMIKPARHRLTHLFFIFLPVLSFYCVRSASTGCRFEALLAGYSPKMIPSSAENRNAPMTSPAEGSTVNCSTVGM